MKYIYLVFGAFLFFAIFSGVAILRDPCKDPHSECGQLLSDPGARNAKINDDLRRLVQETSEAKETQEADQVAEVLAIVEQQSQIEIGCAIVEPNDYLSTVVDRAAKKLTIEGNFFSIFPPTGVGDGVVYSLEGMNQVTKVIYPGDEVCIANSQGLLIAHRP